MYYFCIPDYCLSVRFVYKKKEACFQLTKVMRSAVTVMESSKDDDCHSEPIKCSRGLKYDHKPPGASLISPQHPTTTKTSQRLGRRWRGYASRRSLRSGGWHTYFSFLRYAHFLWAGGQKCFDDFICYRNISPVPALVFSLVVMLFSRESSNAPLSAHSCKIHQQRRLLTQSVSLDPSKWHFVPHVTWRSDSRPL